MKKITLALFALAVAMFAVAPASASTITVEIQLNGGGFSTVATCVNLASCNFSYNNGGVTINSNGSGVSTNLPGSATTGFSTTTALDITNSNAGSVTLDIRVLADGYTQPANGPYSLNASESETNFLTGSFTFQTTGALTGGATCSTQTGIVTEASGLSGNSQAPGAVCTGAAPFGISTLSNYTLGGGAHISSTASVLASTVPEPASIMMFGSGLLGFAGMIRRKLNK
jgi:hypothetical protein